MSGRLSTGSGHGGDGRGSNQNVGGGSCDWDSSRKVKDNDKELCHTSPLSGGRRRRDESRHDTDGSRGRYDSDRGNSSESRRQRRRHRDGGGGDYEGSSRSTSPSPSDAGRGEGKNLDPHEKERGEACGRHSNRGAEPSSAADVVGNLEESSDFVEHGRITVEQLLSSKLDFVKREIPTLSVAEFCQMKGYHLLTGDDSGDELDEEVLQQLGDPRDHFEAYEAAEQDEDPWKNSCWAHMKDDLAEFVYPVGSEGSYSPKCVSNPDHGLSDREDGVVIGVDGVATLSHTFEQVGGGSHLQQGKTKPVSSTSGVVKREKTLAPIEEKRAKVMKEIFGTIEDDTSFEPRREKNTAAVDRMCKKRYQIPGGGDLPDEFGTPQPGDPRDYDADPWESARCHPGMRRGQRRKPRKVVLVNGFATPPKGEEKAVYLHPGARIRRVSREDDLVSDYSDHGWGSAYQLADVRKSRGVGDRLEQAFALGLLSNAGVSRLPDVFLPNRYGGGPVGLPALPAPRDVVLQTRPSSRGRQRRLQQQQPPPLVPSLEDLPPLPPHEDLFPDPPDPRIIARIAASSRYWAARTTPDSDDDREEFWALPLATRKESRPVNKK